MVRSNATDRREALIGVAAALVARGDVESVSMEAVAEAAEVSRALVYKHFENRGKLLTAVYEREATKLDSELAAAVGAAQTLDDMFRALIHGSLRASAERGNVFASLRGAGALNRDLRREQRKRDGRTARWFAAQAVREFGIGEREARAAVSMLLSAIESVIAQWRADPTSEHAQLLERTYLRVVGGAMEGLRRT